MPPTTPRNWLFICLAASAIVSCAVLILVAGDSQSDLRRIGTVTHPPMREVSGIAKSRTHAGVFWAICDSGNPSHVFAIDRTGKLIAEYRVRGATNLDWEAITTDDAGHLYIGDVGNNPTKLLPDGLPSRRVYRIKEPNPFRSSRPTARGQPIAEVDLEQTVYFTFADKPFDIEAMFVRGDELYLISKKNRDHVTRLYRLPLDKPGGTTQLIDVCALGGVPSVTDASLSRDGRRLAVCSYAYAAWFDLRPGDPIESLGDRQPKVVEFPTSTGIEACTWDGDDLILASESREVYSLRLQPIVTKPEDR